MDEKKSSSWDSIGDSGTKKAMKEDSDKAFLANLQAEFDQQPTSRTRNDNLSPPLPQPAKRQASVDVAAAAASASIQQPILMGEKKDREANAHQRNVSWDIGLNVPEDVRGKINPANAAGDRQLQQSSSRSPPSSSGDGASGGGGSAAAAASAPPKLPPRPPPVASQGRKWSVESSISWRGDNQSSPKPRLAANTAFPMLKQPSRLELEASAILNELQSETNLIRDLDKTNPLRPRAGTGNTIFSEVPMDDDLAHNFVIEDDQGLVLSKESNLSSRSNSQHTPTSPNSQNAGETEGRPRARFNSQDVSTASGVPGAKSHRSALSGSSNPRHKRVQTNTVEETLFGLNSAWEEMKSLDKKTDAANEETQTIPPHNDVFATAEMLFNRKTGKTDQTPTDIEHGGMGAIDEAEKESSDSEPQGGHDAAAPSGDDGPDRRSEYSKKPSSKRNPFKHLPYANKIKNDWEVFSKFLRPRRKTMATYARWLVMYVMLPALGIASILFYLAGNPPDGKCPTNDGCPERNDRASASWWVSNARRNKRVLTELRVDPA